MESPSATARQPIVAYHLIFATYGFWLPNDPRGSWSTFVGQWDLFLHGRATKTTLTRSLATQAHDRTRRLVTKQSLRYPMVNFSGLQARAVGRGIATCLKQRNITSWACAVLPDHVHLVLQRSSVASYKEVGQRLPKCFVRGQWAVYLHTDDVHRAIRYVQKNPTKAGLPAQKWSFVQNCPLA